MRIKSKGRGTAAVVGLLLIFAGLVAGAVLLVLSVRRPAQAVDDFARAPVGCTTTLEFTETGTFYVYEESSGAVTPPAGGCEPTAAAGSAFGFDLEGPAGRVTPAVDDSIDYATGGRSGRSIASVEIVATGRYEIAVVGADPSVVAAVGRDPHDGVDDLRRRALAVAIAGAVLGGVLLGVAGWRSRRAATFTQPPAPNWDPRPQTATDGQEWPPAPPRISQVPVNPLQPNEPASPAPPPPPLARRSAPSTEPPAWAPPPPDQAPADVPDPPPPRPAVLPASLPPVLPDRRAKERSPEVGRPADDEPGEPVRGDASP
jgi:hypothetical protein